MKGERAAILDEPTNGLDPQASLDLLDLIRSLKAQEQSRMDKTFIWTMYVVSAAVTAELLYSVLRIFLGGI